MGDDYEGRRDPAEHTRGPDPAALTATAPTAAVARAAGQPAAYSFDAAEIGFTTDDDGEGAW